MTARPAPPRATLAALIHAGVCPYADCREDPSYWPAGEFEAADAILAKFLVLDPSSPELVERIARAIHDSECGCAFQANGYRDWDLKTACAVLAALAPGGDPS